MHSAADYNSWADTAFEDAQEYRDKAAATTDAAKRAQYLKWADTREDDGCFYLSRVALIEEHELRIATRIATNQKAA